MVNFKSMRKSAEKKYKQSLKAIDYWQQVYKMFEKKNKKGVCRFSYKFEHNSDIMSSFIPDDEFKIGLYAEQFGYRIADEEMRPTTTIYYFERN